MRNNGPADYIRRPTRVGRRHKRLPMSARQDALRTQLINSIKEFERVRDERRRMYPDRPAIKSFAILWYWDLDFVIHPTFAESAHIFDRFVKGRYTVEPSYNIDGRGTPGWVFKLGT